MAWSIENPVVVPFDFSEHAMLAVRQAVKLASEPSLVHVLHVLPFMIPTEPGVVWGTIDDGSRIQHALQEMLNVLKESEFGNISLDVRLGDPGQVSAERAEELKADLIVIGSHGRTGLTRLVLGSVAERVTRLAHCPVLVMKLETHSAAVKEAHKAANTGVAGKLAAT